MDTLTRKGIVDRLEVDHPELPVGYAKWIVDDVFGIMADHLASGQRIEIRWFGSFNFKQSTRTASWRSPATGKVYPPRAGRYVKFRAAASIQSVLSK